MITDCRKHQSEIAQEVLAASVNGETWDLTRPICEDATLQLLKWDDAEANMHIGTLRRT